MKALFIVLIFSLSLISHASVMSEYAKQIKDTINIELQELEGQVSTIKCVNHFVGVICYSTIEVNELPGTTCEETYYYFGFGEKVYERLCSTCWFSEGEDIFKPFCH
ncbi:MAG: hypothetical protein K9K67_13735 [Bacteriovoracaceae bacterium]|nr:hypothetical protein [Bacteriovoracaceae bacterium]